MTYNTGVMETEVKQMTIDEFVIKHGLTMTLEPAAANLADAEHPMVGWNVTIVAAGRKDTLTTNYSMGVGCIEKKVTVQGQGVTWERYYGQDVVVYIGQGSFVRGTRRHYFQNSQKEKCMRHVIYTDPIKWDSLLGPRAVGFRPAVPTITEVMDALRSDVAGLDYGFKLWADDCGYDTDSIKAKGIYDTCLEIRGKLALLLGRVGIDELEQCEGL
jgi:hypothetical protein